MKSLRTTEHDCGVRFERLIGIIGSREEMQDDKLGWHTLFSNGLHFVAWNTMMETRWGQRMTVSLKDASGGKLAARKWANYKHTKHISRKREKQATQKYTTHRKARSTHARNTQGANTRTHDETSVTIQREANEGLKYDDDKRRPLR